MKGKYLIFYSLECSPRIVADLWLGIGRCQDTVTSHVCVLQDWPLGHYGELQMICPTDGNPSRVTATRTQDLSVEYTL